MTYYTTFKIVLFLINNKNNYDNKYEIINKSKFVFLLYVLFNKKIEINYYKIIIKIYIYNNKLNKLNLFLFIYLFIK